MIRSLMLVCAVLGAVAFVGGASGSGSRWPKPDARDKALVASVLHGMRTDLKTVNLTQLPAEWRKGRAPGSLELVTTTSVSRKAEARSIRADWDTLLIAHAYNERCVQQADHCLGVAIGPRGGGAAGRSGAKKPFWSAHALTQAIRDRFASAKLHVASIAFEHPNGFAPIITVRSSHPRRAWAAELTAEVALSPALRHSEGTFVQMFDARGRLFYVGSGSGKTGQGWCAPFLHCPHP